MSGFLGSSTAVLVGGNRGSGRGSGLCVCAAPCLLCTHTRLDGPAGKALVPVRGLAPGSATHRLAMVMACWDVWMTRNFEVTFGLVPHPGKSVRFSSSARIPTDLKVLPSPPAEVAFKDLGLDQQLGSSPANFALAKAQACEGRLQRFGRLAWPWRAKCQVLAAGGGAMYGSAVAALSDSALLALRQRYAGAAARTISCCCGGRPSICCWDPHGGWTSPRLWWSAVPAEVG